jgi:hypothetical protein
MFTPRLRHFHAHFGMLAAMIDAPGLRCSHDARGRARWRLKTPCRILYQHTGCAVKAMGGHLVRRVAQTPSLVRRFGFLCLVDILFDR